MKNVSKKMSLVLTVATLFTLLGTHFSSTEEDTLKPALDNAFTSDLKKKISAFLEVLPEERVYLQTDKPLYEPGENIWFSAWLRNGTDLLPSGKSDIISVELISPKGTTVQKLNLIAKKGLAAGDFSLRNNLPGGIYKLRAYTNWMKNEGAGKCFEKEIQVHAFVLPALKMKLEFVRKAYGAGDAVQALIDMQTNENAPYANANLEFSVQLAGDEIFAGTTRTDKEGKATVKFSLPEELMSSEGLLNVKTAYNGLTESISRSVPILRNELRLAFFPEGGELLRGMESRLAFRAVDEFGKGADIEGELYDDSGRLIKKIRSYHRGMGSFEHTAESGRSYYVRITKPAGVAGKFHLPAPLTKGYVLQTIPQGKETLNVEIITTEIGDMAFVAQMRGKVVYTTTLTVLPGSNKFSFSTADFPVGVLQMTVFDNRKIARAERLAFVNAHRKLSVRLSTDKQKYLPREKVKLDILVKDDKGLPAPALLSVAVVNDQLLSFADDRSGNIISTFLLENDLGQKLEDPAYYFSDEPKSSAALDLVMRTTGWRKFTWEKIMSGELPVPLHTGKRAVIAGRVLDAATQKPLSGVVVKNSAGQTWQTDKLGRIDISGIDLYAPLDLRLSKEGYFGQTQRVMDYGEGRWMLYPRNNNYRKTPGPPVRTLSRASKAAVLEKEQDGSGVPMKKDAEEGVADPEGGRRIASDRRGRSDNDVQGMEQKLHTGFADAEVVAGAPVPAERSLYYRARIFAAPVYSGTFQPAERTDFRHTIYWNPRIEVGHNGRASVTFYASDEITSFRATAEGIGAGGDVAHNDHLFYTQLPFSISTRIPAFLTGGDEVQIPVILRNNTAEPLGGKFTIQCPSVLGIVNCPGEVQTIMPHATKTIFLHAKVQQAQTDTVLGIAFEACALSDQVKAEIRVRPQGFPVTASFSGQEKDKTFFFETDALVKHSLRISLSAFPDVTADLMKGVEGILREPYGCFEQTSCTAYPNAMVLQYLQHSGSDDSRAMARANELLNKGYSRLTTFETGTKGYEWFGASPAHEGLTAYGLMEFTDMRKAGQKIDETMFERTARWLMNHRDGKGGFQRETRALHNFGRISADVMNGYIVYALAEAGYKSIVPEYELAAQKALSSGDPYLLALAANAAFRMERENEAEAFTEKLAAIQSETGAVEGADHSITYSQGRSLTIETTALYIMALLQADEPHSAAINKAVNYLLSARDGSGAFSSTQGTVLALKALTAYALYNKRTKEDGEIVVYIDGRRVSSRAYEAGERGEIKITGLEKYVRGEGKHSIRVKFMDAENALPYAVAAEWSTTLPPSSEDCVLDISASVKNTELSMGETTALNITVRNKKQTGIPNTMVVVGVPAGLSVQPWQLKELQERNKFDYYELLGNRLALYYRGMRPGEVKEISFDLKAEIPGEYNCPASTAYLYYTNEHKSWSSAGVISVTKKAS